MEMEPEMSHHQPLVLSDRATLVVRLWAKKRRQMIADKCQSTEGGNTGKPFLVALLC